MANKTIYISAISFGVGALLGCGATYVALKEAYATKEENDIQELSEWYDKKFKELEIQKNNIAAYKEMAAEYCNKDKEEQVEEPVIVKPVVKGKTKKKKASDPEITEPYIISEDQYEDDNGFDKLIVSYFEEDEVLMFDNEEVFDNGQQVLGALNLSQFNDLKDDDTIYIRNEKFGADYQVVLESGSYQNFIEKQG